MKKRTNNLNLKIVAFELFPQLLDGCSSNFFAYDQLFELHRGIIASLIRVRFRQFIPNISWVTRDIFNDALSIIIRKYNEGDYEHRSPQTFFVYSYSLYYNVLRTRSKKQVNYELTVDDEDYNYTEISNVASSNDVFDAYQFAIQKVPFKNELDRVVLNEAILSGSSKETAEEFDLKPSKIRVMKKRKLPILIQLMTEYDNDLVVHNI